MGHPQENGYAYQHLNQTKSIYNESKYCSHKNKGKYNKKQDEVKTYANYSYYPQNTSYPYHNPY